MQELLPAHSSASLLVTNSISRSSSRILSPCNPTLLGHGTYVQLTHHRKQQHHPRHDYDDDYHHHRHAIIVRSASAGASSSGSASSGTRSGVEQEQLVKSVPSPSAPTTTYKSTSSSTAKFGGQAAAGAAVEWKGTVRVEKLNFLDLNNPVADFGDKISELFGSRVNLQLISEDALDPDTKCGKESVKACLEGWFQTPSSLVADQGTNYNISFKVDKDFGQPGAILVENNHPNPFLLRSINLQSPSQPEGITFTCNSWIYSPKLSGGPRIFFSTKRYLPDQTPTGLETLRAKELQNLRGTGEGERIVSDRIYDYDVYNDLGRPDEGLEYVRPILGGSEEFPYPRRCRTGRQRTTTDSTSEAPAQQVYVPRDEQFDRLKTSDFLGASIKAVLHVVKPAFRQLLRLSKEFASFEDFEVLYDRRRIASTRAVTKRRLDEISSLEKEKDAHPSSPSPFELIREITDPQGGDPSLFTFPVPQILQVNADMWRDDSEFARQMLAGVNPIAIQRLEVFPPVSTLDPKKYGPSTSAITEDHIKGFLDGMTAQEALAKKKLYILDYHDVFMPYIEAINKQDGRKGYATRALFYLTKKDILRPIAIELSLPPSSDGKVEGSQRVFVPPPLDQIDDLWNLAKIHTIINDMGFHELVSHWLKTHACVEPFIIATNRCLSAMHPLHSLLLPHLKNTMYINALARGNLINCYAGSIVGGGIIEYGFTPGTYAIRMSSAGYKGWSLDEQGLPGDLVKRGMAEWDPSAKNGIRLFIGDYPYAADGLDVWAAIKGWVTDYVDIYYKCDADVAADVELQEWWSEIRYKGHADKAGEDWWIDLDTRARLVDVVTTVIWMTSCLHAAVNFGQYAYGGYPPARPSMGRRLVPDRGSLEHQELQRDPGAFYRSTLPPAPQCLIIMATLEILSSHAVNEEYLGYAPLADGAEEDSEVARAVRTFRERLAKAEADIRKRNANPAFFNRRGPSCIPYTLLLTTSSYGLTGRGVPNSISI